MLKSYYNLSYLQDGVTFKETKDINLILKHNNNVHLLLLIQVVMEVLQVETLIRKVTKIFLMQISLIKQNK